MIEYDDLPYPWIHFWTGSPLGSMVVCLLCSACVMDRQIHTEWHQQIEDDSR